MNLNNIVIVPKLSKYEYDLFTLMLSHDELLDLYEREGINPEKILQSHKRQKEIQKKFEDKFPGKVIFRNFFTKEIAKSADLVIALGGDNHFTFVSHMLADTPILGINSDPLTSEGVLLSSDSTKFDSLLKDLESDNFEIEQWTRLDVEINGVKIRQSATSEVFVGNKNRMMMSHYRIKHKSHEESQKCSGLIITTGAGSTGWYNSASRYLFEDGNSFEKTSSLARFVATEPYRGKLSGNKLLHGELESDSDLEITSAHRDGGIIAIDSVIIKDFKRDKHLKISISNQPLNVLRFKNEENKQ